MTSEQVLLMLMALVLCVCTGGCQSEHHDKDDHLSTGIYPRRQLWAVVPLRNESGSLNADGTRIADHLVNQLENEPGIDTLPVNRVLAAMEAMNLAGVNSPAEALALRRTLGVDALIVGTITAFDPYDPPQLGLTVELYVDQRLPWFNDPETIRRLSRAAVDGQTRPVDDSAGADQPISVVSGFFDAADPGTRKRLQMYASRRGVEPNDRNVWRLYRISMDLYTEFVTHTVSSRLMDAEAARLAPPPAAEQPAS